MTLLLARRLSLPEEADLPAVPTFKMFMDHLLARRLHRLFQVLVMVIRIRPWLLPVTPALRGLMTIFSYI